MRFTIATVLAFAASAVAVGVDATEGFDRIDTPNKDEQLTAGKPYVVKWDNPAPYTEGPVYIQLLGGNDPNTLTVKSERLATIDNKDKEYTWNVDASLGDDATYGLRFVWEKDDNVVQYSKPFHIKKGDSAGSSTVTQTSSQGVKTVTLSSASTSSSASPSTSSDSSTTITSSASSTSSITSSTTEVANTTTSSFITSSFTTSTARANTTSANSTHTSTLGSNTGSISTTTPATRPSSGAAHAYGSIAVIGGIVAALLTL
ncbi:uncharacterized protein BBA_00943 [Beauveria bassiana ARSEF 2860]|uniref:Yeast cell wall synthesis Kre9/Knh1-like N-terminal domain-containing protein n=1 Tax=Beauveria bassiana (strain ARSEF 2860) TaxID=655819 RepID=J4KQZ7_BEAB2|nr:uncharacterized protein BBA_00943 [Beauveria bassiana ARSEF 2860]EJP70074.1 hypothetical protein BBA_00943 [Beauveria bassiana ARSEF 2860]